MPSASSNDTRTGRLRRRPVLVVAGILVALLVGARLLGTASGTSSPAFVGGSHRFAPEREATIGPAQRRVLRTKAWQGGAYTTASGEVVRVLVSDSYADAYAMGQRWADFFAGLIHGSELGLLTAYVTTPSELARLCGEGSLGCYGGSQLAFIGETVDGVTSEEVARHEYGHHVAFNRINPPWLAVDWGTKRWATAVGVCPRVKAGTAYPGNEDKFYSQNPGEAFAEVYRVLNERRVGIPSSIWPIVDSTFFPDDAALAATEQDVLDPWTAPTTTSAAGAFRAGASKPYSLRLSPPLDGLFAATLTMPRGALYELKLFTGNGRTLLAQGLWSGSTEKRLTATVCGDRSLLLRVTPKGVAGAFRLRVTRD